MTKTTKQKINMEYEILKWIRTVSFSDFYNAISKRVIGQDEGLKLVLAEVRAYIEGLVFGSKCESGGNHHNIIIAAGSGAGKTETYRSLRDYFNEVLPGFLVTIYDVSNITAAGFKGQDPSDILRPYFEKGLTNPYGICFLDELDKRLAECHNAQGEDLSGEIQSQLLVMIEGGDVYCKRGKINTENMMFVGLGSFNSFRNKREETKRTVGIMANGRDDEEKKRDHFTALTFEDIIEAGGSWELIGRFSNIINYGKLSKEAIECIINKVMQSEADTMGVDLDLGKEALEELANIAADSRFGCRFIYSKLHNIIMNTYSKALFELPENSGIVITINTLTDATYSFVPFSEEEKRCEEEYIEKLKNEKVEEETEPIDTVFFDGWM